MCSPGSHLNLVCLWSQAPRSWAPMAVCAPCIVVLLGCDLAARLSQGWVMKIAACVIPSMHCGHFEAHISPCSEGAGLLLYPWSSVALATAGRREISS